MPKNNELLLPVLLCCHAPTSGMRLFDVARSHIYTKELLEHVNSETILFSSHEFIISALGDPHEIVVTNIFTQTQIWLPPAPFDLIYDPAFEDLDIDARYVIRIIISPPSLEQRFVVVFQLNGPTFGYCEIPGNDWAMFEFKNDETSIASMMFYKGVLYAVLTDYRLATITFYPELSFTVLNVDIDTNPALPRGDTIEELLDDKHFLCVLADASVNLLLVFLSPDTCEVRIFRWDFMARKWTTPSSMGGRAVFVSFREFLTWMFPCDGFWAKPDRVYAMDTMPECIEYTVDGTDHQHCYNMMKLDNISFPDPPIWIFPKFSNVGLYDIYFKVS